MKNYYYRLVGKLPVPCSPDEFGEAFAANRVVGLRHITGDCTVSTVFLCLDHGAHPTRPELFETQVFGGPLAGQAERYSTWDEAEVGHAEWVAKAERAMMR